MIRIYIQLLLALISIVAIPVGAQTSTSSFVKVMEERLNSSQNQWLVKQISTSEKSFYANPLPLPLAWDTINHLQLGLHHWHLLPEDLQAIQTIWQPNHDSRHLITTSSLLDLYQPLFRAACESQQLPSIFQWLPLLVSGLNPHYNGPTGRRGLWSLDYLTARKAGLQITEDVDERCGGDFTAKAVAIHLRHLLAQHEDPLKVLLIYLYGAPAVADLEVIEYSHLPKHWQIEVSFLVYSAQLFSQLRAPNHQRTYFDILSQYSPIRPKDTLSLVALEAVLKEDLQNLRGMNPTLIGDRVLPIALKVPYFVSTNNAERWLYMEDSLRRWTPKETTIEHTSIGLQHKVKKGESLGTIARKYKTSVRSIQRLNKLKGSQIQIGQVLIIPERQAIAPIENERPKDPIKQKEKPESTTDDEIYVVKNGDSLWKIAKRYRGVSESDIKRWNNCGDTIRPGQKILIKGGH
jgi:membrane-bound lytic murein transglycosylase D